MKPSQDYPSPPNVVGFEVLHDYAGTRRLLDALEPYQDLPEVREERASLIRKLQGLKAA